MLRSIAVLLALGLVALTATAASGSGRTAHAAKTCSLTAREQRHLGPSYVTSLSVNHSGATST